MKNQKRYKTIQNMRSFDCIVVNRKERIISFITIGYKGGHIHFCTGGKFYADFNRKFIYKGNEEGYTHSNGIEHKYI